MIRIREAILVEGRYDKNALSQLVDTAIFETGGFGVMKDREKIQFPPAGGRKTWPHYLYRQ